MAIAYKAEITNETTKIMIIALCKIMKFVAAVFCLLIILSWDAFSRERGNNVWPIVFILSTISMHWLSWTYILDYLGVNKAEYLAINNQFPKAKSKSGVLIFIGYVFLTLTVFNFYMSPGFGLPEKSAQYAIICIFSGVAGRALRLVRCLLKNR